MSIKHERGTATAPENAAPSTICAEIVTSQPRKPMVSLQEAAGEVSRSYWTLLRDFHAGRLAAIRHTSRGKLYIKRADLEAYLERGRHAAVGEVR